MPKNKPRLHLSLYARPKHPDSPHYALFIAPKSNKGSLSKHHVKNTLLIDESSGKPSSPWRYERIVIDDVNLEPRLLVRVVIAKITASILDVERALEAVPVYQDDERENQPFNCKTWVRDAFIALMEQGLVRTSLGGEEVERRALEYLDRKRDEGRWDEDGGEGVPCMDLLEGRENVA